MKGLLLFLFALASFAAEPPRKQLGGPPSEFAMMELPNPLDVYQVESSVMYQLPLQQLEGNNVGLNIDLIVDSNEYFQFTVSSPLFSDLVLTLTDPTGTKVPLPSGISEQIPLGDAGTNNVPATSWSFTNPKQGTWVLNVVTGVPQSAEYIQKAVSQKQVVVILFNHNPLVDVDVAVAELNLLTGNSVGLVAQLDEPLGGQISAGQMNVIQPDGTEVQITMQDDGQHLDGAANDGLWGGSLTATQAGTYSGQAILQGTTAAGVAFVRSAQIPFAVIDDHTELNGAASTSQMKLAAPSSRTAITLGVNQASSTKYRAYAEVYGTSATTQQQVAVAWISSLVNVQTVGSTSSVTLELDNNWIALANAVAPFELRSVSLQDITTGDLVSSVASMPVSLDVSTKRTLLSRLGVTVENITEEMLFGVRPVSVRHPDYYAAAAEPPMLLSHGYCTSSNPWQGSGYAWSEPNYFLDANANRPNDQFALMLHDFAEAQGIADRWVGIGHSQGGIALTHLLNYYWTGLDSASGRRVQSVGTPYLGNSIAGSAANLGTVFGVGCGANTDMTDEGAATWVAGIAAAARKQVYYYTTTYELGKFFGDSCVMAANALLDWPNDGVTEFDKAQLPGANNMGNTQKQCHTTDMNYLAQYNDNARNAVMNAASRK